jgi:hypothetical protein
MLMFRKESANPWLDNAASAAGDKQRDESLDKEIAVRGQTLQALANGGRPES